ncbi:RelA/SpoT family protein [Portibacter lacus]|uniref:RelA/SpoT family protein n=1 Tax=Portibacter lacus TaxID=1099794 RepID=A0AA37STF5_9BACT|nr:RelA/SpoT family protein [Portibacter lacus]GLR19742.1 RelA/SpoT family protein [Portibacter lacus]
MGTATAINETELKTIRKAYNKLRKSIVNSLTDEDKIHLDKAYKLAVSAHSSQRRKSGEPYVLHPIEVARICAEEIGLGPTAVISALLHDVVEDTPVTIEEIDKMFGPKIRTIVDGLTKLDGLYNVESPQAENFKKVLSTLVEDVRVVLIKMADRIHNLRTIGSMPQHKQLKIAAETSFIYAPLAHRLGLYNVKTEFQDLCLKITEPELYAEIEKELVDSKRNRQKYINEFVKPLKPKFDEMDFDYRITGRVKSISSIANKIRKKRVPLHEIYDIFAVRVIIDTDIKKEKSGCWQIYSEITDIYLPIPERLKDWVTTPKSNGYESLHTTVIGPKGRFVEVQIRSERMDEIAERGFAAHWKYKGVKDSDSVYDQWLDGIRHLLDTSGNTALEFINDFKTNLFSEEIYAFTPKGDMRILPKGATALDFAFDIHTDVGYNATAIKVNNKLVPMGYKLSNGDQVHVTTNKSQKPNENWLKMVVTGKARSKIRSSMKEERRKQGEFGKETLMRKLKNMKADFELNIDMLVKYFGYKSRVDLYYGIFREDINLLDLKLFDVHGQKLIEKKVEDIISEAVSEAEEKEKKRPRRQDDNQQKILINGEPADMYKYTLSSCCNPVQGDNIFAFLSATGGMKIHRTNCPNATNMLANYGYRVMKAEWSGGSNSNFVVDLIVTGVDSGPGVIQKITEQISSFLGLNIRSFSIEGAEGYFEGKVGLFVANKNQLNQAVHSLQQLDGVSSVTRVDKSYNS